MKFSKDEIKRFLKDLYFNHGKYDKLIKENDFIVADAIDTKADLICYNEPEIAITSFYIYDIKDSFDDILDINFNKPSKEDLEKFIEYVNSEEGNDGFNVDTMLNTEENFNKLLNKHLDEIITWGFDGVDDYSILLEKAKQKGIFK